MLPTSRPDQTRIERRHFSRVPLKLWSYYQCLKKDHEGPACESLSEDFGVGGMAMRCPERLSTDQMLLITLFFPMDDGRADAPSDVEERPAATLLARVAHCRALADGDFVMGVEFLNVTADYRARLKSVLAGYGLDRSSANG